MTRPPRDIGASVQARLLQLARERKEDYQLVLTRYANERLLYRLSRSDHADRFVLKGAALFVLWTGALLRATRDLDLLGFGEPGDKRIAAVFDQVLVLDVDEDGVRFDRESVSVGPIRDDQRYGGIRVLVMAYIGSAKVRLQIDIGFGDAITPEPTEVEFPSLLDYPAPRLRAYPRETVVAEKLEAMVQLGLANSRMKDFFDLYILSESFEFDGATLVTAIRATFERRGTALPESRPIALTGVFVEDPAKQTQWAAFVRRSRAKSVREFGMVMEGVLRFVEEPLRSAASTGEYGKQWSPPGPWR